MFFAVLWIRIRMAPELLPGSRSGSGIKGPDPDPAKSERATVNSGLFVLSDSSIEQRMANNC